MEKLKTASRHRRGKNGNKENKLPGQEVGAGFEKVFTACCDNGEAICSKNEWRKFVATLQYQGLVSKKELTVLDRMWADITEAAIATGAAKRKGAPLLTFPEFTDRLLRLYTVPRDMVIQKTIQNLTDQATSLSTLFKEWQIETLNEVQMRQILLAVDALCEKHERVESEVQQHAEHQLSLMNKQHIQTLFWDEVGGPSKMDQARGSRSARTSLLFQQEKSGTIDRLCRKRQIRSIRAIRFSSESKDARKRSKNDIMGHAAGCEDGVSCMVGNTIGMDGKMFVEVVTVPRGPLPATTSNSILNSYAAHRQLSLCNGIPNILGVDDTSSDDEIYYFYSFAPGGITAAELLAIGGPLHESQPLFKFMTSQILNAFMALDEQCTFGLTDHITLNNIIIADVGTQVQLSKLPFGAEISSFGKASDSEIFHLERESMLVNDFGSIVAALLMGNPNSGRKSSAKRQSRHRTLDDIDEEGYTRKEDVKINRVYDKETCLGGVHVAENERFTLSLEANTVEGFAWQHPNIVMADTFKPKPVKILSVTSKTLRGGLTRFDILVEAINNGECFLDLRCGRPWEATPSEPTLLVQVGVHGEDVSPRMDAIIRACVEGRKTELINAYKRSGKKKIIMKDGTTASATNETFVDTFREPWERQPLLRELALHPSFSNDGLRIDNVFADFERFVDEAP